MNPDQRPRIGRELAIVALAYTVLTAIVTWPVVAHLSDAVAGFDGRDSFQHTWLFWRYWDALLNKGQLPSQVDVLYFPQGAFHPVLWLHPLVTLLGLPLTGLLGPLLTYNLVLLISFVLIGIAGYLLMCLLSRDPKAAFIGGLILAFAPNRMGHVLAGHLLLVFNFALPLYALSLWLWLKRPSWRLSSLYAVSLTLVLLSHPNFIGYFLLLVTPVLLVAHWLRQGWFSHSQWKQLFLCWVVSGLFFFPFAWPTLKELAGRGLAYLGTEDVGEHSADLVTFFLPSPFHPGWGNNPPAFVTLALDGTRALEEGFNYIGLAGLVLAGIAVWRRWSQVGPWLVIAGLAMLFSLGPVLKAGGHVTQFTMPYAFISNLPFFSWSRTPARLAMTTMLGVSVLASMGVARIMSWCRRQACGWGLLVGLTSFIVFEYLPVWPFPAEFRPVSPYYYQLGQVRAEGGVLDMPVSGSRRASNYAMYYQTIHHRPLVGGYIERDPPGTEELRLFADRLLSPSDFSDSIVLSPTPLQRVAVLRDLRVTEVIAHPGLMTDQAARATLGFMGDILGTPNYADDDLLAWHVPAVEDILPPYMLLLSEEGWESAGDSSIVRLKQESLLFVYTAQAGPATLTLDLQSQLSPGQQLWIDESLLVVADGERSRLPLHLEAGLNWLRFRLTGCENCSVDFSYIAVE